jgi:predicted ATPase
MPLEQPLETHLSYPLQHFRPAHSPPPFRAVLNPDRSRATKTGHITSQLHQALAIADRGAERWYAAELLRIKGELLIQEATAQSVSAAEDCFVSAIDIAREQSALFWQLRAAMSLARLRVRQDRHNDAWQVLAPVYDRFTEGFETADLRSARAMLESCGLTGSD